VRLPIDVQGRLQSYTASLPLEAVDANGARVPGITLSPSSTDVTVRLEPRIDVQQVSVVPQFVGRPADSYAVERFDWTPKSVDVSAPVVITSTLRTEPITLTGRTESFTQTVRLVDVDGIVTQLENNLVTIDVQIQALVVTSNTPLLIPTVDLENLEPNVRVETPPSGLRVTVSGTYQQFNQLAGTTVRAVVDVQGRGPGTYTLPVEIELPEGVRVVSEPPYVTITLVANPPPTPTAAPQATPTGGS
jgi:YbbR domain-containing protein